MILEAKNIEYVYKSQKDRKVLGDISVRFEEKKFYAIIGASGAGKTHLQNGVLPQTASAFLFSSCKSWHDSSVRRA